MGERGRTYVRSPDNEELTIGKLLFIAGCGICG